MAVKKPSRAVQKKRPVKKNKRFKSWFALEKSLRKVGIVCMVILFAAVGSYFLISSQASPKDEHFTKFPDQPERGIIWSGQRIATSGPCKDVIEVMAEGSKRFCAHPDPGPEGVDVRERDKHVDKSMDDVAEYDSKHPPKADDDPSIDDGEPNKDYVVLEDKSWTGSLGQFVSPRNWPCIGTGTDGARVQLMYVYVSGKTNRVSSLRPSFEGIAKRMNAMVYNSGVDSGGAKQIRFATGPKSSTGTCGLSIGSIAISSASVNDYTAIKTALANAGFKSNNRKYVTWVDGGTACGLGGNWIDSDPNPTTNYNNTLTGYAMIWHPCWNYSEPHELMHTLGAVQIDDKNTTAVNEKAPHSTPIGHCYDQHDAMCYDDDGTGPVKMVVVSACTAPISYTRSDGSKLYSDKYAWRFDCRHDDYFSTTVSSTSNYLYRHWNTAKSRFLYNNPQL
jgi:hypothetical protein